MQKLLEWTLDAIREERSDFSWMEELRLDWVPLVASAISKIMSGQTVLLLTDHDRSWFSEYLCSYVNHKSRARPFIPIYDLRTSFPHLNTIDQPHEIELLEDMLDISFPNGYFIWYIGEGTHAYTKLAYRNNENFLWSIDEQVPNSFPLRGSDPLLDIKLLQLYKLFDKTLEAALHQKVDIEI